WKVPSYERALPHLLQLNCDVLTIECASSDGRDLHLFKHIKTDKKIGIGVVNHCNTVVEPAEHVAALIRKALEYIPKEQLVISTDCGFGREGLSRRTPVATWWGGSGSTSAWRWSRGQISSAGNSACRKRACGRQIQSCGSRSGNLSGE